jgi:hypothetical protein
MSGKQAKPRPKKVPTDEEKQQRRRDKRLQAEKDQHEARMRLQDMRRQVDEAEQTVKANKSMFIALAEFGLRRDELVLAHKDSQKRLVPVNLRVAIDLGTQWSLMSTPEYMRNAISSLPESERAHWTEEVKKVQAAVRQVADMYSDYDTAVRQVRNQLDADIKAAAARAADAIKALAGGC